MLLPYIRVYAYHTLTCGVQPAALHHVAKWNHWTIQICEGDAASSVYVLTVYQMCIHGLLAVYDVCKIHWYLLP